MSELADLNSQPIEGYAKHGGKFFSIPLFSLIGDNLWMGGCPRGELPPNFDHVVCLYQEKPYMLQPHVTYFQAQMFDAHDVPDEPRLRLIARHINECRLQGPTLVHCQAGLNRSGLLTAYALYLSGMTPDAAIRILRVRRSEAVLCNEAFEAWLRALPNNQEEG